jgi:hypothetical protein
MSLYKKLVYIGFGLTMTIAALFTSHDFLAINKPIHGDILVVEGWIPVSALNEAKRKFEAGNYALIAWYGDTHSKKSR